MKRYILICSCFNMEKKAREAFSVLFPNEVSPDVVKGRDRLAKFAATVNNEHIKAISKLRGKFAYFVELDDADKIVTSYNLLTGKRVA